MVADTLSVKIIFFNILTLRKIFKIQKINNIDPGYKLKPFFDLIENYGVCPDHYNLRANFRVILI